MPKPRPQSKSNSNLISKVKSKPSPSKGKTPAPFAAKKSNPKSGAKPGFKSGGKMKGPKSFKRRRPEEHLDIQYTDKELGEMSVIKRKLQEIREYKKILAEDGLKPDQQDKERESELIVRLLRIEKNAKMAARQRAKAAKTEAFRAAAEKAEFAKQKKKSRDDRFAVDDREDDRHDDTDDDY